MLEFKQTLRHGQVVDADWWVTTKLIALIVTTGAITFGILYPFI